MSDFSSVIKTLIGQIRPQTLSENEIELIMVILNRLFDSMEEGNSCLRLTSANIAIITLLKSELAALAETEPLPTLPLTLYQVNTDEYYLYLTRYYYYEYSISNIVKELNCSNNPAESSIREQALGVLQLKCNKFDFPNIDQFKSIQESLTRKFSIITGGPGTGKTTSVVLMLWSLYQIYGDNLKVKIGAPTGKAAKRVKESLQSNINGIKNLLNLDVTNIQKLIDSADSFGTIHKLLGYNHQSIYFKHNEDNNLDVDVLIIDESSMIGLPLFQKLISTLNIKTIKHVIFLGDPNQLSSVEEGFVFNSLVNSSIAATYVSRLSISKRNQGDVGKLANAILANNEAEILDILTTSQNVKVRIPNLNNVMHSIIFGKNNILEFINYCSTDSVTNDLTELFKRYTNCAVLCMTNVGRLGVTNLNIEIERAIKQQYNIRNDWYSGRSIIILENEKSLQLFNGDIGICIITDGKPRIYFDDGRSFIPEVLPRHQLSYAITIHKSQGSEYEMVKLIIATNDNHKLLSKELIYTGITRAKTLVEIFAEPKKISKAEPTLRISGLKWLLK